MGDGDPTELAAAETETASVHAWGLADEDYEDYTPGSRFTSGRVTAAAVAASLIAVTLAGLIAWQNLRNEETALVAPGSMGAASAPADASTPIALPPPRPPSQPPPAPVTLRASSGSVFVKTRSGKTVCQVTAGKVGCNVAFTRPMPILGGLPASGVSVTARGSWEWLIGDPGDPDYTTLSYETVYQALGWTITPTSDGTTFMNDATGHGVTVSVEGFTTF